MFLKFYNLSEALGSFGLTPSSIRHRLCWRSATSTHFSSSTIYTTYKFTIYTTIHREATLKTALELLDTAEDSKPSADNNTRYSPSQSITEWIKFTKRVELWTDFWQLDHIFEPPGRNELYGKRTDGFFSRLTRPYGRFEARVLRAPKTLTPLFAFFFTDFENKTDCFAV